MEKVKQSFHLPVKKKIFYGVGHVLNDLCASMWFSYMLLYLHKVAGLNNVNAGLLLLVGQIADALATPFVGYQSDKTENVRYGRRKVWHLIGVVCVAVSFPFIFSLCIYNCSHSSQAALMIYYTPFIVIFQFGWASTQISHLSLIPELTVCKQGKVELNAIRYFFTILSNLLVFVVCFVLFEMHHLQSGSSETDSDILCSADHFKFQYLAICVVAVGLLFVLIFHCGIKEEPIVPFKTYSSNSSSKFSDDEEEDALIKKENRDGEVFQQKIVKDWVKTPVFYQVGMLYMMTRLIMNVSQVYISYFVLETLKMQKSSIAVAPAVIYVSGILASLIAKKINSKLGLKFTFFFGLCLIFGSCTWFYFVRDISHALRYEVYGGAALLGMGSSTLLIDSLAMVSEMIGKNTNTAAFVYGAMSFLDKLSNGAAIMLIQYFHPCKDDVVCCGDCQRYYGYVMVFIPGGAAVLGLLVLLTLRTKSLSNTSVVIKRKSSYGSIKSSEDSLIINNTSDLKQNKV